VWGFCGARLNAVAHYQTLAATGACETINKNKQSKFSGHSHHVRSAVRVHPYTNLFKRLAQISSRRIGGRYYGVFAPHPHLRQQATPVRRGRRQATGQDDPPSTRHAAMTWAQRLKRVFKIDSETC